MLCEGISDIVYFILLILPSPPLPTPTNSREMSFVLVSYPERLLFNVIALNLKFGNNNYLKVASKALI